MATPSKIVMGSHVPDYKPEVAPGEITAALDRLRAGEGYAAQDLLPVLYDQLRKLAQHRLAAEKPGQTLQPTALVHEAYLRLIGPDGGPQWSSHGHFFSAAAEAMRRILIDRARHNKTLKRGGTRRQVDMAMAEPAVLPLSCEDLLGLDEALAKLHQDHPRKAELVKLRFFAGLTISQAAEALGVSTSTAENDWAYARSWLRLEMAGND